MVAWGLLNPADLVLIQQEKLFEKDPQFFEAVVNDSDCIFMKNRTFPFFCEFLAKMERGVIQLKSDHDKENMLRFL